MGQPPVTLGRDASGNLLDASNGQVLLTGPTPGVVLDGGGAVYNVKAYGAAGNGVALDTAAIRAAISACNLAGGGTVYFPTGTYLVDAQIATPNSAVWISLVGAGEGATKITTTTALSAYVLQHLCNGFVMDLTVDGGGVATGGFFQGNLNGQSAAFLTQGSIRTRFQNIAAGSASWVAVWWDINGTYQCQTTYLEDVIIAGPSSTVTDGAAWSYIDRLFVKNLTMTGISRSPNFYIVNTLIADGIYSDGCLGTASLVFDANCLRTFVSHLVVVGTATNHSPVGLNTPFLRARDWYLTAPTWGIAIKAQAGFAGASNWEFDGCHFDGIEWTQPLTRLKIIGGYVSALTLGCCLHDITAGASTTGEVTLQGVTLDAIAANHYPIFKTTNAVTWTNATMMGCNIINAPASLTSGALTFTTLLASSQGYANDLTVPGHLISTASGTPATSNLGANVTSATFTGNDTRGTIAIVMSGALAANTRVCTATFATSYGATAPKVTLVDQTSAVGLTIVNSYVLSQSTGVSFDIAFDQALAAGTYTVDYIVIG